MEKIEKLKKIYIDNKISWNHFKAEFDDALQHPEAKFEVTPVEYLRFAKVNIGIDTKQARIDAMGNIKRAIEAQIDLLVTSLGYDYRVFDNRNTYVETKKVINEYYEGEEISGVTQRIKLLNILGLAPTFLISNIRNLRNKMEHEYIIPPQDEVKSAFEVAELFIFSSTYKFSWAYAQLEITNINNDMEKIFLLMYSPHLDDRKCLIRAYNDNKAVDEVILEPNDKFYIYVLYSLFNENCILIPDIFGCKLDRKYIKWE